ncbi:hypothetical protein ACNAW0_09225 [Micromonospora sp. SL1-18]|uniref:hypothetical protein n=1 Tax=Micromonospora sp. SL1-18 TaxID=3399128 RepID=UPI003A4DC3A8
MALRAAQPETTTGHDPPPRVNATTATGRGTRHGSTDIPDKPHQLRDITMPGERRIRPADDVGVADTPLRTTVARGHGR